MAGRLQAGRGEGAGGALSVGAGDVEGGVLPLGVVERGEGGFDPIEPEADDRGREALQKRERLRGGPGRSHQQSRLRSCPILGRRSFRGMIESIIPCSRRNSDRWKPSGNFWGMVCSIP